jgi:hypothetical protein
MVLQVTLHALWDVPTRSLKVIAQRFGVAEADVAALVMPTEGPLTTIVPPAAAPTSPLLAIM